MMRLRQLSLLRSTRIRLHVASSKDRHTSDLLLSFAARLRSSNGRQLWDTNERTSTDVAVTWCLVSESKGVVGRVT